MKLFVIPVLALLTIVALLLYGAVPQDPAFHNFADNRKFAGVPNFWDVITNIPFFLVGVLGITAALKWKENKATAIAITLFFAFVLLTAGSGYYHLQPNNERLVYDRIPMTIIFMSFFSFIIYDRIDKRIGFLLFIVLNIMGVLTVIYWIITERAGSGDLRWYGMVQFFPVMAILLILFLYKSPLPHEKYIIPAFILFGAAKSMESLDGEIFQLTQQTISGHSLKHLFMAIAGLVIVQMIRQRSMFFKNSG